MPVGELAALLSALIFSMTAVVDKLMTSDLQAPAPVVAVGRGGSPFCPAPDVRHG